MKQVKGIGVLHKLRNGEHYQIHDEIIKYLESPIVDFTDLVAAYAAYKEAFEQEKSIFKYRSKMLGTDAIAKADKKRDNEFINIRMIIKSNLYSIDPDIRSAAELLWDVIEYYKATPRKGYKEATAFITNLIKDFERTMCQPSVLKLGLAPAVALLDEANRAFKVLYNRRTSWLEERLLRGNMLKSRPQVDEAFKALVLAINALYVANEVGAKDADKREKLTAIIDEINGQLDDMARTIAYRKPSKTASKPEPEAGGEIQNDEVATL